MHPFINLNAQYGIGQSSRASYSTAAEVLQQMDRLGIWQTVLEFPMASNSLWRNQVLLEDMQKLPNWKERIIPAFQIDPGVAIETGAMEKMISMMETYRPCCLVLRPKAGNHRLRMAELYLEQVAHLDPVCLIDKAQLADDVAADDLVWLAHRYPNMRFVIRQFMHSKYTFVLDILRRTDNVYTDTSRLYTRGAIELFADLVGVEKLLFSTDGRANHGAAMGALAWADLSEEDRDKIRFGNFISLFSDPKDRTHLQDNCKAIPNGVKNRFWTPFVEERKAPDVEIYDSHTHLGATGGYLLRDMTFQNQVAAFEEDMAKLNVKKVVSSVSGMPDYRCNLMMEAACKGKEDRFLGYIRFNPLYAENFSEAFLDDCFSRKYFIGLKTLPAYMDTDIRDARYAPMFAYAHKHGLPILIHTWDTKNGTAKACAEAAAKWPNAKVILGHSGGGSKGRAECHEIAKDPQYANVYFEFCGSFTASQTWEETLEHIPYERVLYGTDACLHSMYWEMSRLLSADIPDEALTAILGGNAKKLFGF